MGRKDYGKTYNITIVKLNRAIPIRYMKVYAIDSGVKEVDFKYGNYKKITLEFANELGEPISIGDAAFADNNILVSRAQFINLPLKDRDQFPNDFDIQSRKKKLSGKKWTFLDENGNPIPFDFPLRIKLYTISYDSLILQDSKYEMLRKRAQSKEMLLESKIKQLEGMIEELITANEKELEKERKYWSKRIESLKKTIKELRTELDIKEEEIINTLAHQAYKTISKIADSEDISGEEQFIPKDAT
ncbi:MAG: hypothetical protein ACP6IY_07990 [Promethearchaeia archaeon]